jgi:hypothetical protein
MKSGESMNRFLIVLFVGSFNSILYLIVIIKLMSGAPVASCSTWHNRAGRIPVKNPVIIFPSHDLMTVPGSEPTG